MSVSGPLRLQALGRPGLGPGEGGSPAQASCPPARGGAGSATRP